MSSPQSSLAEIRLAMARTNALFHDDVFVKRNFAALDQIYTSDARILPPAAPMISGREAIKKFWSDAVLGLDATSAKLTSLDVMLAGDGAVEIGAALLTLSSGATMEAKFVVYWRQEDGLWKWHVDIWNLNA